MGTINIHRSLCLSLSIDITKFVLYGCIDNGITMYYSMDDIDLFHANDALTNAERIKCSAISGPDNPNISVNCVDRSIDYKLN